jgi:hypothetical protein
MNLDVLQYSDQRNPIKEKEVLFIMYPVCVSWFNCLALGVNCVYHLLQH